MGREQINAYWLTPQRLIKNACEVLYTHSYC